MNAFPEEDGLQKFRQWVESPDPTILGKLKKGSKVEEKINSSNCNVKESASDHHAQEKNELSDYIQEIKQTFINKHVIDFLPFELSSKVLKDSCAFIVSCLYVTSLFSFLIEKC